MCNSLQRRALPLKLMALLSAQTLIKNNLGKLPKYLVTDKGYGTQSNYEYLVSVLKAHKVLIVKFLSIK